MRLIASPTDRMFDRSGVRERAVLSELRRHLLPELPLHDSCRVWAVGGAGEIESIILPEKGAYYGLASMQEVTWFPLGQRCGR